MSDDIDILQTDFIFYSLFYAAITVVFAMAVVSKFLTKENPVGFSSFLSLVILFLGEPVCHAFLKGILGVFTFGVVCFVVYRVLPSGNLSAKGKTVLITGCDSGFGNALAKKLDGAGMKVFAGCLNSVGSGAIELQATCSQELCILQLDVTNDQQVISAYELVTESVKDNGLWGLVNNAGMAFMADIEMTPYKVMRNVMEVNLFGMIRVTKTFLPLIKKSRGRIVNMSSLVGKIMFPGFGIYGMSKHAIEGFSDCLRLEMKKWGVGVTVIEPTGFRTGWVNRDFLLQQRNEVWNSLSDDVRQQYGRNYLDRQYELYIQNGEKFPTDLSSVVKAVESGLLAQHAVERRPVGRGGATLTVLASLLPTFIMDKLVAAMNILNTDVPANSMK